MFHAVHTIRLIPPFPYIGTGTIASDVPGAFCSVRIPTVRSLWTRHVRSSLRRLLPVFVWYPTFYHEIAPSLCILSGEIGGGSTEALICLGISVSEGL